MSTQPPDNPRQRLKQLLAIPDSQRTEAQWDEIIELEITLAPGNRVDAPRPNGQRKAQPGAGKPGGGQGKRTHRKTHRRPPKPPAA